MSPTTVPQQIALTEHQRRVVEGLTAEQALALQATDAVSVTPTRRGYEITAKGLVGAVSLDGLQLHISPKVGIRRLLYLLGYATDQRWRDEDLPARADEDVVNAVATLLCWHTERALAGGILQGYRRREEAALTVRGRIRTSDQISRRFGLPIPVEVAYDDYDTDIDENRMLRTALRQIRQLSGIDNATRQRARRLHGLLCGASELPAGVVPEVRLTRRNQRYASALFLARLVLHQRSLDLALGPAPAQAFLISMPAAFEAFLTTALSDALRSHGGDTLAQHTTTLHTAGAINVRPDLVWRHRGRVRAVIDAKYKSLHGPTGPSGDMYQALAYCIAHDLPRCWLVYAAGNETPSRHTVRHLDATIHIATLDLTGNITDLHADVRRLAADIAETT